MSKPLQFEHSNSATLSAVCTVMPGYKSEALNAHAFVSPRLGQGQNGRFALHEPEASTEFGDP